MRRISFKLDEKMLEELDALAYFESKTRTQLLIEIISSFVRCHK
jgi:metal-responsive CopG/Arc/MetJ family transcriptional regulator